MPKLRAIRQPHAGAGAARQNGLEHCRGRVVLFLDDDVLPLPGLASAHLCVHRKTPGLLVVGSLPPEPPPRRTVHSVVEQIYVEDYDVCCRDYERDPDTVLAHLWSGNMSLSREQALAVGVGDPEFDGLFFEDRDFGMRLRRAGVSAVYRPDLRAVHRHVGRLRSYLRDSVRQGRALVLLSERYPDEVPPPTADFIAGRFPSPARWMIGIAQRNPDGAGALLVNFVLGVSYLAGKVHLWRIQRLLVVFLRRVGQGQGVGLGRRTRTSPSGMHCA